MKKILNSTSPYLIFIAVVEAIISVICTIGFVYSDTLSYQDSLTFQTLGVEKLLESIYSSTWWALILMLLALITIFTITSIIYKKLEFHFISSCLWIEMLILAIDLNKSINELISIVLLFIPIMIINIIAYKDQKKKIREYKKKNKASK